MKKGTKDTGKDIPKRKIERARLHPVTEVTVTPYKKYLDVTEFPIEIFPTKFQDFVGDVATCFNSNKGLIASI